MQTQTSSSSHVYGGLVPFGCVQKLPPHRTDVWNREAQVTKPLSLLVKKMFYRETACAVLNLCYQKLFRLVHFSLIQSLLFFCQKLNHHLCTCVMVCHPRNFRGCYSIIMFPTPLLIIHSGLFHISCTTRGPNIGRKPKFKTGVAFYWINHIIKVFRTTNAAEPCIKT